MTRNTPLSASLPHGIIKSIELGMESSQRSLMRDYPFSGLRNIKIEIYRGYGCYQVESSSLFAQMIIRPVCPR